MKKSQHRLSTERRDAWIMNQPAGTGDTELLRRFRYWVWVQHQDGSTMMWNHAFAIRDDENEGYIWVFTEHNGYHTFAVEDLDGFRQFKAVPVDQCDVQEESP